MRTSTLKQNKAYMRKNIRLSEMRHGAIYGAMWCNISVFICESANYSMQHQPITKFLVSISANQRSGIAHDIVQLLFITQIFITPPQPQWALSLNAVSTRPCGRHCYSYHELFVEKLEHRRVPDGAVDTAFFKFYRHILSVRNHPQIIWCVIKVCMEEGCLLSRSRLPPYDLGCLRMI